MKWARRGQAVTGALLLGCASHALAGTGGDDGPWSFAAQLASGGDAEQAAIEFRRIAAAENDVDARGSAYWHSAYQYLRLNDPEICAKMLDRSEDAAPNLTPQITLLRGERALSMRSWDEAAFYFQSVLGSTPSAETRAYVARRLAQAELRRGNPTGAKEALRTELQETERAMAAIETYEQGRDRSPFVGGVLGLVPGLGYAYSGEYANAVRSFLLNSLFGFAMYHTASRDEWGAFSAISFFELTWYSGSIYGGVDAAQRYNEDRRDACGTAICGNGSFEPDWAQLPLIRLQFKF